MITFAQFIMEEGVPIYLQILLYLKRGIAAGTILPGDELPSRRMLSSLLGVNPNTVQKAYHLLEEEGLIQSHSGAKSYVVFEEGTVERIREELTLQQVKSIIASMKQTGLSKEEALALLEKYWD